MWGKMLSVQAAYRSPVSSERRVRGQRVLAGTNSTSFGPQPRHTAPCEAQFSLMSPYASISCPLVDVLDMGGGGWGWRWPQGGDTTTR